MSERCPYCNSKSGVDVKNRLFCHACKRDFPQCEHDLFRMIIKAEDRHDVTVVPDKSSKIHLPLSDFANRTHIPIRAFMWLSQYFTEEDLPDCFWSVKYQRLCFPYYRDKMMIGCWMRSISGITREGPKWLYAGEKEVTWLFGDGSIKTVCLCEDVVSAIKISKYIDCVCLGGTTLHECDKEILKNYQHVVIFLDSDDAGIAGTRKIQKKLDLTHLMRVIKAGKDPKNCTNEELQAYFGEYRDVNSG